MSHTLEQLLTSAATAELPPQRLLRFAGPDAKRWLNGMVTASAQALAEGEGAYTFLLNSQGRILGDGTLYREGDAYLLSTGAEQAEALQAHLDRFIIMDDVELTALPPARTLLVAGPETVERLIEFDITAPANTPGIVETTFNGMPIKLLSPHARLIPRIEITGDETTIEKLAEILRASGVATATTNDLQALRLISGTPLYGVDINERDLPQETGQDQALHFSKGCYLGQEIVERIHSRGQVHRTLQLFELSRPLPEGQLPLALTTPDDSSKPVGSITSAATFELRGRQTTLGLGIVRRGATAARPTLRYSDGEASAVTTPFDPLRITTAAD